jgi:hypothetical protein
VHAIQQPPILQEDNITYPAQTETNNRQCKIKINSITSKAQNKIQRTKTEGLSTRAKDHRYDKQQTQQVESAHHRDTTTNHPEFI